MICIECTAPTDSLFTEYSNKYVQLTECKKCHCEVDKYIEIDNVLLFIDLLLLKPGAYRHLVYNSLEVSLTKFDMDALKLKRRRSGKPYELNISWFQKYSSILRLWVLFVALEVYITWVEQEQIFHTDNVDLFNATSYKIIMQRVINWHPIQQYLFFLVYCLVDNLCLHALTELLFCQWQNWGNNTKYPKQIISYTILLSHGVKIFPILMLIWPYDNLVSMSIIKWVANLYLIESLKIITNLRYGQILKLLIVVFIIRYLLLHTLSVLFLNAKLNTDLKTAVLREITGWKILINDIMSTINFFSRNV
ncbi:sterol homeostasis protein ARV1 [Nakaseomyces bracarensis]|uniref:sterol homeostasis protein ARV1 n=1 Tax=Nakaseomyces bracarensis TaxID=273131 RepID=UPI003871668B